MTSFKLVESKLNDFRILLAEHPKMQQLSSRLGLATFLMFQSPGASNNSFYFLSLLIQPSVFPVQKSSMISEDEHALLHDVCCLWEWLVPKLKKEFPGSVVERHVELFMKGLLDYLQVNLGW